ncbi:MAG: hypothetical protein NC041_02805 [Bacteroides sp.]|nr:hypothetical protein [Prevotella sp.]MCM1408453.1 hypothetical protein [Treponema brennaborense]MCM1469385.1 hypothetical protein [Bacteroides sp.]
MNNKDCGMYLFLDGEFYVLVLGGTIRDPSDAEISAMQAALKKADIL